MSAGGSGRVVIPSPAQPPLGVVLTCGVRGCGHCFEPDPVAFVVARLACPSCGGWVFAAELVESAAGAPGGLAEAVSHV